MSGMRVKEKNQSKLFSTLAYGQRFLQAWARNTVILYLHVEHQVFANFIANFIYDDKFAFMHSLQVQLT